MDRTSSVFVVIALIAATSMLSTMRGDEGDGVAAFKRLSGDRADPAPIILAQGRCFNGRCF